jgi:diguanylate cyclase (GGDEF)-like protein/PAS domain S-box-containing protein
MPAYFVAGWLGLRIPYASSHITLVWLPTGIAVAALYRWGIGLWPAVYGAAFLVNLSLGPSSPGLAAGIAVGNTLGPLATSWGLRRLGFDGRFAQRRHVLLFLGAAAAGMLLSSIGGVFNLHLAGLLPVAATSSAWMSWWMGDTVGVLLAGPLLLLVNRSTWSALLARRRECLLWLLWACLVGWFAFVHDYASSNRSLPMAFLTLPLVAWAAMRLQRLGAAVAGFGFSVLAAVCTGLGHGTFYLADAQVGLFLLWSYMSVTMMTGLMIGAMQAEREDVEHILRQSEERLKDAQQVAQVGNVEWDVLNDRLWWSDQYWRLWGLRPEEHGEPTMTLYQQGIHPDDWPQAEADFRRAIKTKTSFSSEYRVVWPDGSVHDVRSIARVILDEHGKVSRMIGTAQDITEQKRRQADMQRSEIKFRTLYDSISDAVMLLGEHGMLECNQAALDLFGCKTKVQFLQAHPAREMSPPQQEDGSDSATLALAHLERVKREGALRFEWLHRRLDNGRVFPAEVWLSATELDGKPCVQGIVRDITERRLAEQQIQWLAFYDELTKLPNRRLASDRLGQALAVSRRNGEHGAIMMLDLDNFKTLNDTQGHDAGDRLLVEAATRIQACVRQQDTVARFGGDEFVVLIEGLGLDEAEAVPHAETVAEKIRTAFDAPFQVATGGAAGGRAFRTSCSIGVVLFKGQELSIDELLKQADVALYQAKGAGRNTARFFSPEMQAMIESYSAMEAAMHQGLQSQEFRLFYQPQVDQKGRLIGAEALLRWFPHEQHPVSPAQFIPLAEETGLIVPIGSWVIQAACAQLQGWATQSSTRELVLAINVSARQFRQPDFVKLVRDNLQRHGVNPALLKLELTESVVLDKVDEVIARMMQIKALGVTFALDDFGTGFSSLSYLKRLPLDQVKIDQSFVRDVTTDPSDAAIVRAILAMSRSLGMQVIAEGVETKEQLAFLSEHGCEHYQGYLFSKPMSIDDWARMSLVDLAAPFSGMDPAVSI